MKANAVKDYQGARKWYVKILDSSTDMVDHYNFMVADWNLTHIQNPKSIKPKDNFSWKIQANFSVEHKDELLEKNSFIAETAQAMIEGSYDGKAEFVPQYNAHAAMCVTKSL